MSTPNTKKFTKLLLKDERIFLEEYVSDDLWHGYGKSYLIVTTLITNLVENDRIGRRRVWFETGKFVHGVTIQGGVDKDVINRFTNETILNR